MITYFRRNRVMIFWWASPSWWHTSLRLPTRTSNLSSRRMLLARISLELFAEIIQRMAKKIKIRFLMEKLIIILFSESGLQMNGHELVEMRKIVTFNDE